MASIKTGVGTPLDNIEGVSATAKSRLRAVSVTTAEELLGILTADRAGTQALLGAGADLDRLEADVAMVAEASGTPSLGDAPDEIYSTGAAAPDFVETTTVKLDDIERRMTGPAAAGPSGIGADLRVLFGPVRDQGRRGTCVAHAVCAVTEALTGHAGSLDLSEQFLYWNAKDHDGQPASPGTSIKVAMDLTVADGICDEVVWPYVSEVIPGNEGQGPPPADIGGSDKHRLSESAALDRHDSAVIRNTLDQGRPVALSVPVFPSWVGNPMLKLSGFIPMPLPGTSHTDGHAMCGVGYGFDSQFAGGGFLILRNSWGIGFAPQSPVAPGHALLPFAYWDEYGWELFAGTPP